MPAAVPPTQTNSISIPVSLGSRSYVVEVGHGLLKQEGPWQREQLLGRQRAAVVTDSTVGPLYAETVLASLARAGKAATLITVPAGEGSKSLGCAETVLSQMARAGLDRKSFL
ncbi:MAG TPA: 3-dehydroquinate synthase, partial [Prosthecobacter sp.]|nr:3-dehydroquinate synthase [Prosthecobacter sp.]